MKLLKKQGMNLCFAVIVAVLAAMPLLLQSGVLTASSTILYLGKCIAFAIVAMGLDLIWGYTGILSLGHGLYFALGGYAMAMYLKLQATGGSITDFMHVGGTNRAADDLEAVPDPSGCDRYAVYRADCRFRSDRLFYLQKPR